MSNQWDRRKRRAEMDSLEAKILETIQLQRWRDIGQFLGHVITVEKAMNVLLQELKHNGTDVSKGIARRSMDAISRMSGAELGRLGRKEMEEKYGGAIGKRFLDFYEENLAKGREAAKGVLLETGKEE